MDFVNFTLTPNDLEELQMITTSADMVVVHNNLPVGCLHHRSRLFMVLRTYAG